MGVDQISANNLICQYLVLIWLLYVEAVVACTANTTTAHSYTLRALVCTAHQPPMHPPTPCMQDYYQSLTPFHTLQLCSFPRLTAAYFNRTVACTFCLNSLTLKYNILQFLQISTPPFAKREPDPMQIQLPNRPDLIVYAPGYSRSASRQSSMNVSCKHLFRGHFIKVKTPAGFRSTLGMKTFH